MNVSLIVCTYQRPDEVKKLLQILNDQTVFPNEIIVVDGSLDDKTKMIIKEVKDNISSRISYIKVDKKDRGLTRQRNVGISHAKSEIIAFLDDDTIPKNNYFAETLLCFQRHPEAVGVGGSIVNEISWNHANFAHNPSLGAFRWREWERRDDLRWRLRKLLRLDSTLPPGWMPPFGHGRPSSYPSDGNDYPVEFVMGGASAWRRHIFDKCQFSTYFEGYGLYEDLDFCIRAVREGSVYFCTRAQLEHRHASGGRPDAFLYGKMVVRNGWFVWRRRWMNPPFIARVKWWLITFLLAILRLVDFRNSGLSEALGRFWGMLTLTYSQPDVKV